MSQFAKIHNLTLVATAVQQLNDRAIGLPGFAVIYGPAGWSKSTSLQSAALQTQGYYVQMRSAWGRKALLEKILVEMAIKPAGTIAKLLDQVADQPIKRYVMVRDNGIEAPRLDRKGQPVTHGLIVEQMWKCLRRAVLPDPFQPSLL